MNQNKIRNDSLTQQLLSAGCTGAQEFCKSIGCTETRIGSYVYERLIRVTKHDDLHPKRCPLAMAVTVVSTAASGQIILDMTTNLHDRLYPMRNREVVDIWEVTRRGRGRKKG